MSGPVSEQVQIYAFMCCINNAKVHVHFDTQPASHIAYKTDELVLHIIHHHSPLDAWQLYEKGQNIVPHLSYGIH